WVRGQTGGKDRFLGLRHVLFSLVTAEVAVPRIDALLKPIGHDAAWLASRLTEFLQGALEPGERWEEWVRLIEGSRRAPGTEAPSDPVEWNIDETPLSEGARFLLTAAWRRAPWKRLSSTQVLLELVERGRARGRSSWSADFLRQEIGPVAAKFEAMRSEYWARKGRA